MTRSVSLPDDAAGASETSPLLPVPQSAATTASVLPTPPACTPVRPNPLPFKQMFMICVVTFVEPVQFGMLFPFIYFLVRDFNVAKDDRELGFYVGALASSFCVAQLFTSLPWGWVSDRIGRRPVILIGLIGNAITCALFGISESFVFAICLRTLCGLLNGNIGVIKSMLGEITDGTNRGIAFAYWESAFGIGTIIGPVIGGLLVDPVNQIPSVFGNSQLLLRFPYLLPCLVSAFISIMGALAGYFMLEETLRRPKDRNSSTRQSQRQIKRPQQHQRMLIDPNTMVTTSVRPLSAISEVSRVDPDENLVANTAMNKSLSEGTHSGSYRAILSSATMLSDSSSHVEDPVASSSIPEPASPIEHHPIIIHDSILALQSTSEISIDSFTTPPNTTMMSILSRNVVLCICSYAVWSFLQVMYDEIYALFIATPLRSGGLQFTSFEMGILLSLVGFSQVFGQLVLYPMAEHRYGYVGCFRLASVIMIVFSILLPFVGDLARNIVSSPDGIYTSSEKMIVFSALMFVLAGRNIGCVIGFIAVMILVNDSAPGKHALGTVHGFGQVAASFVRSVGPALGGSLWAWSLTNNLRFPFDFHFTLFITALLAVIAFWISFLVRHGPDGVEQPQHHEEEVFSPLIQHFEDDGELDA